MTTPNEALRAAAQALVDRWDQPVWKDVPHTGEYIAALRAALAAQPAYVEGVKPIWETLEELGKSVPPEAWAQPAAEPVALSADNFEWSSLYNAVSHMMARLGADGEIDRRHATVNAVMDALHRLDAGVFVPGLAPRAATHPAPAAEPAELSSDQRSRPTRFNVTPSLSIEDDDFLFDALINVTGDFGEGMKAQYVAEIARRLNAGAAQPAAEPVAKKGAVS